MINFHWYLLRTDSFSFLSGREIVTFISYMDVTAMIGDRPEYNIDWIVQPGFTQRESGVLELVIYVFIKLQ